MQLRLAEKLKLIIFLFRCNKKLRNDQAFVSANFEKMTMSQPVLLNFMALCIVGALEHLSGIILFFKTTSAFYIILFVLLLFLLYKKKIKI